MDCIGFYTIHAFLDSLVEGYLASFLKLIILLCDILILVLPSLKSLSLVAPTRHAALNLACLLEVGQQAWCTISKFTYQEQPTSSSYDPQASGTGTDSSSSQARVLVSPSLCWAFHEQETPSKFFLQRNRKITTDELHTRTTF